MKPKAIRIKVEEALIQIVRSEPYFKELDDDLNKIKGATQSARGGLTTPQAKKLFGELIQDLKIEHRLRSYISHADKAIENSRILLVTVALSDPEKKKMDREIKSDFHNLFAACSSFEMDIHKYLDVLVRLSDPESVAKFLPRLEESVKHLEEWLTAVKRDMMQADRIFRQHHITSEMVSIIGEIEGLPESQRIQRYISILTKQKHAFSRPDLQLAVHRMIDAGKKLGQLPVIAEILEKAGEFGIATIVWLVSNDMGRYQNAEREAVKRGQPTRW